MVPPLLLAQLAQRAALLQTHGFCLLRCLQEELWCHRYYLRNLCNEQRFAGWHIRDHVQLLQVREVDQAGPNLYTVLGHSFGGS